MKSTVIVLLSSLVIYSCSETSTNKTVSIKVNGVCSMCKETMEKPLTKDVGVISRNWNVDSKIMEITYDTTAITLREIESLIAQTGYKTEHIPADTAAYNNLHECCKYDDTDQ